MSSMSVEVDIDRFYVAWRQYLLANSEAKYFGMVYDPTKPAKFPYANIRMISRPRVGSDLQGEESSITLTFETEAYIKSDNFLTLYNIDTASADFFIELGFARVGDSQILKVSDTVTKITSRFTLRNYTDGFEINIT